MSVLNNAPAPIQIDFSGRRRSPGWVGWAAFVIGACLLLAAGWYANENRQDILERETIVAQLRAQYRAAAARELAAQNAALSRDSYDPARMRLVLAELNADWSGVFAEIAAASGDAVKVREIHADALRGTLRVLGRAGSMQAVFDYVAALQKAGPLRGATLESHANSDEGGNVGVNFSVSARWGSVESGASQTTRAVPAQNMSRAMAGGTP